MIQIHCVLLCSRHPQVFDGAVIVLSLAPMVASTVANGPSSPWDAISLIITLRIWRVKRIIDGEEEKKTFSLKLLHDCINDKRFAAMVSISISLVFICYFLISTMFSEFKESMVKTGMCWGFTSTIRLILEI